MRALCAEALDSAVAAGASYADARAILRRDQLVATRNGAVLSVSDQESEGIGVRVLVDGPRASPGAGGPAGAAPRVPPRLAGDFPRGAPTRPGRGAASGVPQR